MLTDDDVQEIVRLLDELPFDELHLTTRHFTLSLRRDGGWVRAVDIGPAPVEVAPQRATPPDRTGLVAVRTPLPGTFYRAPKPGAPPFVHVGDAVEEHTVVAIVETMKLMNSVPAGARGRVAEICLPDAQVTDQDAVLMWIEPG
jgi:acetyl-CoA carboxylase biotin carboxyl carrier protein